MSALSVCFAISRLVSVRNMYLKINATKNCHKDKLVMNTIAKLNNNKEITANMRTHEVEGGKITWAEAPTFIQCKWGANVEKRQIDWFTANQYPTDYCNVVFSDPNKYNTDPEALYVDVYAELAYNKFKGTHYDVIGDISRNWPDTVFHVNQNVYSGRKSICSLNYDIVDGVDGPAKAK